MAFYDITTEDALTEAIKDNKSVVVMFGATWSQVTVESKKAFERNAKNYDSVYHVWIDIDQASGMQKNHKIEAIPTTFGYKSGDKVTYFIGPMITDLQVDQFVKKTL